MNAESEVLRRLGLLTARSTRVGDAKLADGALKLGGNGYAITSAIAVPLTARTLEARAGQPGSRGEAVAIELRGRVLFDPPAPAAELTSRILAGGSIRAVRLSDGFGYSEFRDHFQDKAVVLFVSDAGGSIAVATGDLPGTARAGQTLFCLMSVDTPAMPAVEIAETGVVEVATPAKIGAAGA